MITLYKTPEQCRALDINPEHTCAMIVRDESMMPLIKPGTILIDQNDCQLNARAGLFVVHYDNKFWLRYWQRKHDGSLLARRLNTEYDDESPFFAISPQSVNDARVIGKVIIDDLPIDNVDGVIHAIDINRYDIRAAAGHGCEVWDEEPIEQVPQSVAKLHRLGLKLRTSRSSPRMVTLCAET